MKINAGTLHDYLTATLENAQDHTDKQPQLMHMVYRMDEIFHQEIFEYDSDVNPAAGLLAMNSYTMLLSAVQQALTGHIVPIFTIVRAALESACYAYLIALDEEKGKIWLDRHSSKSALQMSRNTFTAKKAANELKLRCPEMAEYVMAIYDAAIDFGAHPNQKSVFNHLEDIGPVGEEFHGFELTGVYGRNSWQVNHALLACIEYGQAIAFLIAASTENHPLTNDRLHVFQNWMNEKTCIAEELNGKPIEYSGPMYCSVIPPA